MTLHRHGPFRFALYPFHGGRAPELDDARLLRRIGRFVGRLHLVGECGAFEHRPRLDLESFGVEPQAYLLEEGFIPESLRAAYETLCADLFAAVERAWSLAGGAREIRLHGDFHPGNLLVRDEALHIVDLDDARSGPAVQDLWMFLSGDREEQTPQLDELLGGYHEFRELDSRELHLIEALRTLRLIHYAAWLARRWEDPAFRQAFPWFDTDRYWDEHVLALREQAALMQEPPLVWRG